MKRVLVTPRVRRRRANLKRDRERVACDVRVPVRAALEEVDEARGIDEAVAADVLRAWEREAREPELPRRMTFRAAQRFIHKGGRSHG